MSGPARHPGLCLTEVGIACPSCRQPEQPAPARLPDPRRAVGFESLLGELHSRLALLALKACPCVEKELKNLVLYSEAQAAGVRAWGDRS